MSPVTESLPHPRGRPRGRPPGLSPERISRTALSLMEESGGAMSVRQLATQLGVDPMAIYHYFPSKTAVVESAVSLAFTQLDQLDVEMARARTVSARLEILASGYLRCIRPLPMLTRSMALDASKSVEIADRLDRLFALALGIHPAADPEVALARDVFVDYLHGHALAGTACPSSSLGRAVRFLASAMCQPQGLSPMKANAEE